MNTPLMSLTTASSHRNSRPALTTYERILATAVTLALAVVAAVALTLPSGSSSADVADGPVSSAGQVARGKATLPTTSITVQGSDAASLF